MCGTRNGWMAVFDGAQNVVEGVARAAAATKNAATINLFIGTSLGKALPCAPGKGAPVEAGCNGGQMSKYRANSSGVGRSRTGFSSRSILLSIQASMTSSLKTFPL